MPAGAPEDPDQASEIRIVSRTHLFPADADASPYAPLLRQIMNTGTLLHQAIRAIAVQRNQSRRTIVPSKIRRETRPATAEPSPPKCTTQTRPCQPPIKQKSRDLLCHKGPIPHDLFHPARPMTGTPIRTCYARASAPVTPAHTTRISCSLYPCNPTVSPTGSPVATHTTRKVSSDHPAIKRTFQTIQSIYFQIHNPYKSSPVFHGCGQRRRSRRKIFFQNTVLCIAKYQSTYYICSNKVIYPQNNTPVTGEP